MTITENDLLTAIYQAEYIPTYDPAIHVTREQIALKLGISAKAVEDMMKRWSDRVETVTVRRKGKRVTAYRWK